MSSRQQRRAADRRAPRGQSFDWGRFIVDLADLAVPHVERLIAQGHAPEAITAAVSRIGDKLHVVAAPLAQATTAAGRAGCPLALAVTGLEPVPGATWCLVYVGSSAWHVLLMRGAAMAPGGSA